MQVGKQDISKYDRDDRGAILIRDLSSLKTIMSKIPTIPHCVNRGMERWRGF